jgi:hypothetical protein
VSEDPRDDRLRRALRAALPPTRAGEPARDLWPLLRRRLEERPLEVSRLDWALLAALLTGLIVFPDGLVTWLYHL